MSSRALSAIPSSIDIDYSSDGLDQLEDNQRPSSPIQPQSQPEPEAGTGSDTNVRPRLITLLAKKDGDSEIKEVVYNVGDGHIRLESGLPLHTFFYPDKIPLCPIQQTLELDPDIAQINTESGKVVSSICRACRRTIATTAVGNWLRHRARCPAIQVELHASLLAQKGGNEAPQTRIPSQHSGQGREMPDLRLFKDPYLGEIKKHKAYCKTWIVLDRDNSYRPAHWRKHSRTGKHKENIRRLKGGKGSSEDRKPGTVNDTQTTHARSDIDDGVDSEREGLKGTKKRDRRHLCEESDEEFENTNSRSNQKRRSRPSKSEEASNRQGPLRERPVRSSKRRTFAEGITKERSSRSERASDSESEAISSSPAYADPLLQTFGNIASALRSTYQILHDALVGMSD